MANQYQNFSNPTIIPDQPYGWQAADINTKQAINSIGGYLKDQQDKVQGLQIQQAQDLSKARTMAQLYYPQAIPAVENMMAQNPYARRAFPQSLGQAGQPQGQGNMGGNPNMMGSMIGAPGTTPYGTGMLPTPTATTENNPGNIGGSSMNPVMTGGTITSGGMEPPKFSQSIVNPVGTTIDSQAKAQGEANVKPSEEFATKMAGQQALSQENLARDSSQMTAVFATLRNLHDIHSQLASSVGQNMAGTDLGDLANENLGHLGTVAALTGHNPADWQNALVKPENQSLIGQFQAGRNEGITRAIQPLQNQVDKTGSSRIMDSLLDMTQGEYGKLDDPQAIYDGKTIGTAKTLYRITLASQNYADQLKAKGIKLDGNDPNFNPDVIASHIYNQAQGIQFTPAQAQDFNKYANQVMQSKNVDYSGIVPRQIGGSQNPLMNGQRQVQTRQLTMQTAQQLLNQTGGDKNKARLLARQQGYSF